jgi:hypothetical protein
MTFVRVAPINPRWHEHADQDDAADDAQHGASAAFAPAPALSPDVVSRFHALIDEVTDQLMQGRSLDRPTCRADAIALLIATSQHLDEASEAGESPLMYLLLEEQQKAAGLVGRAQPADCVAAYFRA